MEKQFINLCREGKLKEAQQIYSENNINIHVYNDLAFRWTCSNGHIEIAKWLMTLDDKPNIHVNNDFAFRFTCSTGYIEVAKWLYLLEDK